MKKLFMLFGFGIWILVTLFYWWAWSNLLQAGFQDLGALVGFGILALVFSITVFGLLLALMLLAHSD